MQGKTKELAAKGLGLAAISYDSPEILAEFSRRRGITFPLLSDHDSATIKAYGILNTVAYEALAGPRDPNLREPSLKDDFNKYVSSIGPNSASLIKGTPFPGTFVIDRGGRVTARFFEDFYRERDTASAILLRLGANAPPVAATRIATPHVEITTYSSDSVVTPGNRFALAVAIKPAVGEHVYAPGASGYRIVKLQIDPQPWVRVLPVRYPPSEIYYFKPLKERVPVYAKPFTLLQDILIEVSIEAEAALAKEKELRISGSLEYQSCNDRECFNPATVPVSWVLELQKNITERITRP